MTDFKQSKVMLLTHSQGLLLDQEVQIRARRHCRSATLRTAPIDNLDSDILYVLRPRPFGTILSIAEEVGASSETVRRRLGQSLYILYIYLQHRVLKWVSHFLTCDLKRRRLEFLNELLEMLRFEEGTLFHRVITGGES